MKISLDFHDASVLRTRYDLLLQLKEHYPQLKVSLFTIPFDYELEMNTSLSLLRNKRLQQFHDMLDWVQIIPHGLVHMPREFEFADRQAMKMSLQAMDEQFTKDGLPYEKGFCAPHWLWNQDVVDVLNEQGWWGAVDRNQSMVTPKTYYKYSHSITEPFWKSTDDVLKLHGHMTLPSDNNLEDCLLNLMKMPSNAEFVYVTDFLESL